MRSNSLLGLVFSHYLVLIRLETGEQLTSWMYIGVQPFSLSACKPWGATHFLDGCSAVLISGPHLLKQRGGTHSLDECPAILFSGPDLLKHWRVTYSLDGCLDILVSHGDLLKHWRATHNLYEYLAILSCDLLKTWRVTHNLDKCLAILVSGPDMLKHWRATHNLDGCSTLSKGRVGPGLLWFSPLFFFLTSLFTYISLDIFSLYWFYSYKITHPQYAYSGAYSCNAHALIHALIHAQHAYSCTALLYSI